MYGQCDIWPVVTFPAGSKLYSSFDADVQRVPLPDAQSSITLYTELKAMCDQQAMIVGRCW